MFTNTELYKHAVNELNMLLEQERQDMLQCSIQELYNNSIIFDGMTPQEFINSKILNIIASIDMSDLDASSLKYILDTVTILGMYQNLTPLKLNNNEFEEVAIDNGEKLYQNKRNYRVFKTESKGTYHLDGPDALDKACGIYKSL